MEDHLLVIHFDHLSLNIIIPKAPDFSITISHTILKTPKYHISIYFRLVGKSFESSYKLSSTCFDKMFKPMIGLLRPHSLYIPKDGINHKSNQVKDFVIPLSSRCRFFMDFLFLLLPLPTGDKPHFPTTSWIASCKPLSYSSWCLLCGEIASRRLSASSSSVL